MGITSGPLTQKIRHIERIADQEDGTLQVYLVEMDSVTVAARRDLARALRDRVGNYVLVLTSTYDQIDFVLVEREVQPATSALGLPRVVARPRTLTVSRQKPGRVDLRVLRRFTYTEADADAQYDKLLSAYTIADWSEPDFNNRALFSDYYLTARLPELHEWKADPKATLLQLRTLYRGARERFARADEATVRSGLIEPVLQALGFHLTEARGTSDSGDYLVSVEPGGQPAASVLAYTWGRQLDAKAPERDAKRPDHNPGARVVTVLDQGGAPWSIVTNGKVWRLYAAAARSRATNYYEIDLDETLALDDPSEAFRYFWLLFRAQAFASGEITVAGERRKLAFLEQLRIESETYARQLGERLKNRIFEDVFPELARGFIVHMRHLDGPDADLADGPDGPLDQVFRGTLTLLYRLLFLLYAELGFVHPERGSSGERQGIGEAVKEGAWDFDDLVGRW